MTDPTIPALVNALMEEVSWRTDAEATALQMRSIFTRLVTERVTAEQERDALQTLVFQNAVVGSDLWPLHIEALPDPNDATPNEVISVVVNWPQLAAAIWQLLELAPHGVIVRRET